MTQKSTPPMHFIKERIGFIRNELTQACSKLRAEDREWILARIVTEVEQAHAAGYAEALASHAPSEAAAQPTRSKQVPEETISDEIRLGKRKLCGHIAPCDCQNGIFQAEIEHNDH